MIALVNNIYNEWTDKSAFQDEASDLESAFGAANILQFRCNIKLPEPTD